jgi:hypothetical protein
MGCEGADWIKVAQDRNPWWDFQYGNSLLAVYLTTFSQSLRLYSVDERMNNESEMMWREAVVAQYLGTIPAFAWRDWEKPRQKSARIACLRAEIRTRDLPNTAQEC